MRKIAWIRDDAAVPCIRQAIELDYSSGALWDALLHIGSPAAGEAIEALTQTSNAELAALAKARLVEFELYDLEADPGESTDIAALEPERCRALAARLAELTAAAVAEAPAWDVPEEVPLD